jgi:hypothetical protein
MTHAHGGGRAHSPPQRCSSPVTRRTYGLLEPRRIVRGAVPPLGEQRTSSASLTIPSTVSAKRRSGISPDRWGRQSPSSLGPDVARSGVRADQLGRCHDRQVTEVRAAFLDALTTPKSSLACHGFVLGHPGSPTRASGSHRYPPCPRSSPKSRECHVPTWASSAGSTHGRPASRRGTAHKGVQEDRRHSSIRCRVRPSTHAESALCSLSARCWRRPRGCAGSLASTAAPYTAARSPASTSMSAYSM